MVKFIRGIGIKFNHRNFHHFEVQNLNARVYLKKQASKLQLIMQAHRKYVKLTNGVRVLFNGNRDINCFA
jgi:hypothetical protein